MSEHRQSCKAMPACNRIDPATPLWRLAPTHGADGHSLADFMMLIPGLVKRPRAAQRRIEGAIREVCESFAGQVVFAEINYPINVLWVSVAAERGLTGRVAREIRRRVPEALLVGGQIAAAEGLPATRTRQRGIGRWLGAWRRRANRLLGRDSADV